MIDQYEQIARDLLMRIDVGDLNAVHLLAQALRQAAADEREACAKRAWEYNAPDESDEYAGSMPSSVTLVGGK